jgi:hypothetical protein
MAQVAKIPGRVVSGFGGASKAIPLQRPFVRKFFAEIDKCHDGTINVLLDHPLQVRLPDIVTRPIPWVPNDPNSDERFGITEVKLEVNGNLYEAWLYTAEGSPHRFDDRMAEVIAEHIPGLAAGLNCAIHIRRLRVHQLVVI